jgi:hypothetical protein
LAGCAGHRHLAVLSRYCHEPGLLQVAGMTDFKLLHELTAVISGNNFFGMN